MQKLAHHICPLADARGSVLSAAGTAMADYGRLMGNPRGPGEVMKHLTENLGDRQAVEIQIELK